MTSTTTAARAAAAAPHRSLERVPPHAYFVGSAVFHYLGPAFAVLLFARVDALGVAWLRIASAAVVFAAWRRPWRTAARLDAAGRRLLLAWGAVLAVMNCCFYLAIDRLALGTVAAIELPPGCRGGGSPQSSSCRSSRSRPSARGRPATASRSRSPCPASTCSAMCS